MSSHSGKKSKKKSERKDQADEETGQKMDTTAPVRPLPQNNVSFAHFQYLQTVYNEWRVADGLFRPEDISKTIWFKGGFVRVRKQDWDTIVEEGWAVDNRGQSFHVPAWHYCEVLGSPHIMFTKD